MKIRYQIHTISSRRDTYGNCYHVAIVTSNKTGKSVSVYSGGESNGPAWVRRVLGVDWSEISVTHETLPIKRFDAMKRGMDLMVEDGESSNKALRGLELEERMYSRITQHGKNLLAIFPDAVEKDPVKLAKKLRTLEIKAHRLSEDYCNGVIETSEWEGVTEGVLERVAKVLNPSKRLRAALFINGDARGYALKIRDEVAKDLKIHRDMGGDGILAPDLELEQ